MWVDSPAEQRADTAPAPPTRRAIRAFGLLVSVAILVLVALASIAIAKGLALAEVWHGLSEDSGTYGDVVVADRLSRTVLGHIVDATRAVVWMTGSLNGRDWDQVWPLLALCAVLVPLVLANTRGLRMMEMGDDVSYALGVRVERVRALLMIAAVLLTASATAAAGPVSFVALTAPQLARRLTFPRCPKGAGGAPMPGPNLLPSLCMGAALLVTADWASQRAFAADQLPVGVVTGVLGGVYLLWLLVTERRAGRI